MCGEAKALRRKIEADRRYFQPLRSCTQKTSRGLADSVSEKACGRETKLGERSGVAQRLRVFALTRG